MTEQVTSANGLGMVQVYTGDGKGKTTAALGLALRAAGHGLRTYIGQFLKGRTCGELKILKRLSPNVTVAQYGIDAWVRADNVTLEQRDAAQRGLAQAWQAFLGGEYDIVVLDEVNMAVYFGVLTEEEILELVANKPSQIELLLTGRRAPQAILERADLVTEMQEVQHPFHRGVPARPGIEF